jgi:hypothetical protein
MGAGTEVRADAVRAYSPGGQRKVEGAAGVRRSAKDREERGRKEKGDEQLTSSRVTK